MIQALNIKGSTDIPVVKFNNQTGYLFMGGASLPENVLEFYNPILSWLENYKNNSNQSTHVEFSFEYLNTASTNMMAKVIRTLLEIDLQKELSIVWYYMPGDYDMKELGVDLLEGSGCNYNISEL